MIIQDFFKQFPNEMSCKVYFKSEGEDWMSNAINVITKSIIGFLGEINICARTASKEHL
jgi:hypothetical protein